MIGVLPTFGSPLADPVLLGRVSAFPYLAGLRKSLYDTGTVNDVDVVFTDNTTSNSSTAKHGYLRKLDNSAAHFLDGQGNWSTPPDTTGASAADVKDYRRSPIYLPVTLAGIDDEFDDGSFSGSWTAVNSGSHLPTITEDDDMCSMLHPGSDASAELHAWMQAVTVNTNNYIEAWVSYQGKTNTAMSIGVVMSDGVTYNAANTQVIWGFFNILSTTLASHTKFNTAGTATNTNLNQSTGIGTGIGLRLQYLGSNNWAGFVSLDGISWLNVTGTLARTMTPTSVGFFCSTWNSANPALFTFRRVRFG